MLKLHSNAYANCDQKSDNTCKHFQYIYAQISEKHPLPKKIQRALLKLICRL